MYFKDVVVMMFQQKYMTKKRFILKEKKACSVAPFVDPGL